MRATKWWATVTAAGVGVFALAVAGTANATEADYIYDLNNSGIGGPRDQLLALGTLACTGKQNNVDRAVSIADIGTNSSLAAADAGFLYDSATMFLCP